MARSTESVRQLLHDPSFRKRFPSEDPKKKEHLRLLEENLGKLNEKISALIGHLSGVPSAKEREESDYMYDIEKEYQRFSTDLLRIVLIPHWWMERHGLVASRAEGPNLRVALREVLGLEEEATEGRTHAAKGDCLQAAEEFLAIRYIAVVRVVLVNLRFLMLFVSAAFVCAIVAWNSYPFQPRQFINWVFTILLFLLGTGMVRVLAQMYRDPILSRITNTRPNELGWDFFLKVVSFGALPVLSWLAYNYPEIGGTLFRMFQPAADFVK